MIDPREDFYQFTCSIRSADSIEVSIDSRGYVNILVKEPTTNEVAEVALNPYKAMSLAQALTLLANRSLADESA